jgi:hypothetical protein
MNKIQLALTTIAGLGLVTACAAEPAEVAAADAPEIETDSVSSQDEGTSYNGWAQDPYGILQFCYGNLVLGSYLGRSYGDETRGGGACFVRRTTTGCSADSTCLGVAQAQWGASAYGYCYQGTCYSRPGGQATYCALNPNRGPGYLYTYVAAGAEIGFDGTDFALGCMTKTAGPNTACGGTNGSLYMRTVDAMEYDATGCM